MASWLKRMAILVGATCTFAAEAATFCVDTVTELQNALATAATNGEHDVIRIETGVYAPTSGTVAFNYGTPQNFDLVVEGGWVRVGLVGCATRLNDPALTVLDGGGSRLVLRLLGNPETTGAITVRNLTVRNGAGPDVGGMVLGAGAGLGTSYGGRLFVDRVIVRENHSNGSTGGLSVGTSGSGAEVEFLNSVIAGNTCAVQSCAGEIRVDSPFSNPRLVVAGNTVSINTCPSSACGTGGGLRLSGTAAKAIYNNALFFNEAADLILLGGPSQVFNNAYGILSASAPPASQGNNLVGVGPNFVNGLAYDFRLAPGSPLIDAGSLEVDLGPLDAGGLPRLNGPRYDIGAHENQYLVFKDDFETPL
jgi:hypothetical protein